MKHAAVLAIRMAARGTIRKGRYAVEDYIAEVALAVRKQPLKSVGICFGLGVGIGALAGRSLRRK